MAGTRSTALEGGEGAAWMVSQKGFAAFVDLTSIGWGKVSYCSFSWGWRVEARLVCMVRRPPLADRQLRCCKNNQQHGI